MTHPRDTIPGWGADLDPANRPGVPKERRPPRLEGVHWQNPPAQQPRTVEVLQSSEYLSPPPVFGSSVPPRGASGWIRRRAFRHSENDLRHWLMLLLADRVDAVEGIVSDTTSSRTTHAIVAGVGVGVLVGVCLRRWRG